MKRYLCLDVETTGVTPDSRIVEIAWIEIGKDLKVIEKIGSLIDPQMPIPASAMGVHHITDQMVEDAPTISEFFNEVIPGHFSKDDHIVLIAHNAIFDRRFVAEWIPIGETLCTLRLARELWPDLPDHKLQTLRYHFKLEGGRKAHGAAEDCETLLALLQHMATTHTQSLEGLLDMCKGPLPIRRIPFGKYKGQLIEKVPSHYLTWLLGQDIDTDLWASIKAIMGK